MQDRLFFYPDKTDKTKYAGYLSLNSDGKTLLAWLRSILTVGSMRDIAQMKANDRHEPIYLIQWDKTPEEFVPQT